MASPLRPHSGQGRSDFPPRHDLAGQYPLPRSCFSRRPLPFECFRAEVRDLLPLGLRGAPVMVPGFLKPTRFTRRPPIVGVISAPEFQRSCTPSILPPHNSQAIRLLPHLEAPV
jgi:hypothetical protein